MISKKNKILIYTFFLFVFSVSFNQYYGNLGINPIDSFWFFNSGYDVLQGYYPFRDYWTIAGVFITFTQALIFKLIGVSWFSYVFHASIYNFIICFATFKVLYKFNLNINYCFFYALLVSILAYPSAGTPYVDHHSAILSIISIYCFVLALKTGTKIYWFFLPILLTISFLCKQTPTGYFLIIIIILTIFYFTFNFNKKKIFYGFIGCAVTILFFFSILFIFKISLKSFLDQYIFFPTSIGKIRLENFLFPLEFSRVFLRYKLIHISTIVLIVIAFKKIANNYNYLKANEFFIILSLIASSYALIIHQLMTINGIFIFFVIPIFSAFSHIYLDKYFKDKKFVLYGLIILSLSSTLYYGYKYVHKRDFMDLRHVTTNKWVDAKKLDIKLDGLKWISSINPSNPNEEISKLLKVKKIIENDKRNKSIITDYQFLSVILESYDFSPSQVWFINHVVTQKNKTRFFNEYKNLLINKIKKNKIEVVYLVKPLWGGNDVFERGIDKKCYEKSKITDILDVYLIINCSELQ